MTTDSDEHADGEFDAALLSSVQMRGAIDKIRDNTCHLDDLRLVGTQLWAALRPPDVFDLLDRIRGEARPAKTPLHIRVCVPPKFEPLPWETLYEDGEAAFLATNIGFAIIREPAHAVKLTPPEPHRGQRVRMLTVIPEGSGLHGADYEAKNLSEAIGSLGEIIELERLAGRVTSRRLDDTLRAGPTWDIVHFIGHGELDGHGAPTIRLNGETPADGDCWLDAEIFAEIFRGTGVRLAVLNCCLGGSPSPTRTLGGVGPFLLRSGVPAAVAMRYAIDDDVAVEFSNSFYTELLRGADRGRVDLALAKARRDIMIAQSGGAVRGFVTPVFHLAPGSERLFEVGEAAPLQPRPIRQRPVAPVPPDLVDALGAGRCVLVIGPALSSAGAVRQGALPPSPRELALQLGKASEYPRLKELEQSAQAGDWLTGFHLPLVCQHFEHKNKRWPLISFIQHAYKSAKPSATFLTVAKWNVPLFVYTHFDGLLQEALRIAEKSLQVVSGVDATVNFSEDETLLMNLRGTLKRANSLVLTEEDHDLLWDSLGKLPPRLVDMVKGREGQTALFLGISPRDPLVKRLSSRLLESGQKRLQGPTFFACAEPEEVDDAFWEKFDVRWLPVKLDELVNGIDGMVSR